MHLKRSNCNKQQRTKQQQQEPTTTAHREEEKACEADSEMDEKGHEFFLPCDNARANHPHQHQHQHQHQLED